MNCNKRLEFREEFSFRIDLRDQLEIGISKSQYQKPYTYNWRVMREEDSGFVIRLEMTNYDEEDLYDTPYSQYATILWNPVTRNLFKRDNVQNPIDDDIIKEIFFTPFFKEQREIALEKYIDLTKKIYLDFEEDGKYHWTLGQWYDFKRKEGYDDIRVSYRVIKKHKGFFYTEVSAVDIYSLIEIYVLFKWNKTTISLLQYKDYSSMCDYRNIVNSLFLFSKDIIANRRYRELHFNEQETKQATINLIDEASGFKLIPDLVMIVTNYIFNL